jgi:hypothetical protein
MDSKAITKEFKSDLENLINKYSMENGSDTPDWILAEYLCQCLVNFNATIHTRHLWYFPVPEAEPSPAVVDGAIHTGVKE